MMKTLALIAVTAALLSACAQPDAHMATDGAADRQVALPSERIAAALAFGTDHHDRKHRMTAVQVLDGLGARPLGGEQTDFAKLWENDAFRGRPLPPVYRGRILGPAYRGGVVAPRAVAATNQVFSAGQAASLSVAPLDGARLALAVRNAGGSIVCQTDVKAPTSSCRWMAPYAERYHIEISNQGSNPAKFFLVVD